MRILRENFDAGPLMGGENVSAHEEIISFFNGMNLEEGPVPTPLEINSIYSEYQEQPTQEITQELVPIVEIAKELEERLENCRIPLPEGIRLSRIAMYYVGSTEEALTLVCEARPVTRYSSFGEEGLVVYTTASTYLLYRAHLSGLLTTAIVEGGIQSPIDSSVANRYLEVHLVPVAGNNYSQSLAYN